MRRINWRRMLAVIALVTGAVVGAGAVPASAAVVDSTIQTTSDAWW